MNLKESKLFLVMKYLVQCTHPPAGKFSCHAYSIRFDVVESGADPSQILAFDFALITPEVVDYEVAAIDVMLYLPSQDSILAQTAPCGTVAFEADQIISGLWLTLRYLPTLAKVRQH
ncbi:hypothetical protein R1flu_017742 [Riccia fluitans]|uniref:Uncharacterized protein n=1 Tax=Riccia fluitans TaxID=41844 RepID=A0ABD1ZH80_9MARC